MFAWYRRLATLTSAVALAVIGELAGRYITGDFDALRAVALLAAMLALGGVVLVTLSRTPRRRIVIDLTFLTVGIVAITIGVLFALPGRVPDSQQAWILKLCLVGLGLLVTTLAAYAVFVGLTGRDVDFLPALDLVERDPRTTFKTNEGVATTRLAPLREEHESIMEMFRTSVSEQDLHFVAYYVSGKCLFFADTLDSPLLDRYFHDMSRPSRRLAYERHGRQIIWLVSALDRSFRRIQGGILIRTVLDVQYGALYHFPVAKSVDLIGVTLIQDMVKQTDTKLERLKDDLADLPRGGKFGVKQLDEKPYYLPRPAGAANVTPLARHRLPHLRVSRHMPAPEES